jgi:hypothetical protein
MAERRQSGSDINAGILAADLQAVRTDLAQSATQLAEAKAQATGLQAVVRLRDIEIARVNLEHARTKYNYASLQITVWQAKLAHAERVSEGKV